jgi:hypothetical protein
LDWNLQDSLKEFIINVEYTRSGKQVFHGTTIVGFVGILQAVKPQVSLSLRLKGLFLNSVGILLRVEWSAALDSSGVFLSTL